MWLASWVLSILAVAELDMEDLAVAELDIEDLAVAVVDMGHLAVDSAMDTMDLRDNGSQD